MGLGLEFGLWRRLWLGRPTSEVRACAQRQWRWGWGRELGVGGPPTPGASHSPPLPRPCAVPATVLGPKEQGRSRGRAKRRRCPRGGRADLGTDLGLGDEMLIRLISRRFTNPNPDPNPDPNPNPNPNPYPNSNPKLTLTQP